MPFNVEPPTVEVPLDVFGGLVTEMSANDLPEGVSPDCQDVVFTPGSVLSRPGLQKVFTAPFPDGGPFSQAPTLTYAKTYVDPKGVIRNLYLDSNGGFYVENVTSSPGTKTLLFTVAPGSYCKSITAFGREYIAISDGLNGTEMPLQYDGNTVSRVTQDGPGAAPTVTSLALPSVAMVASGAPPVIATQEYDPQTAGTGGYFTSINVFTTTTIGTTVNPGDSVVVNIPAFPGSVFNGTFTVLAVFQPNLVILSAYLPPGTVFLVSPGTMTVGSGVTMTRVNNVVTVKTASAHQLQVGYQAQIAGVPAGIVGTAITSIVINNEDLPGIATVTTSTPHGLIPNLFVSIGGVNGVAVGGGIATAVRNGQVVTVTTNTAHKLTPGATVTIAGVTDASFNTVATVQQVTSATKFTYIEASVDATTTGGTVTLNWPIPNSPIPTYFQVLSAPTPTTFQVSVAYSDGTWASGSVSYAWDGTFFVASVPSTTTFTYQQYGPNATSSTVGTVTPFGQASPGLHQMQVLFLTDQGYITRPSPPVQFVANGGQYISVTNIPSGPNNVVGRILAFTGAGGALFFYIPVPAQVNGQIVSTATQINDGNSTQSILLDFSDNTLFAATAISIPGNNLAAELIIDGALGFGSYDSRLIAYGMRNTIQNLLNMGFDGGFYFNTLPPGVAKPIGWIMTGTGGSLVTGHLGINNGYEIAVTGGGGQFGNIHQSMYQDAYGAPIATASANYTFRAFFDPSAIVAGLNVVATISSASLGFTATATFNGASMAQNGSYLQAAFNQPMPAQIPSDLILTIYATSSVTTVNVDIDEMFIFDTDLPFLNSVMLGSYVNNPGAFDGVTGQFGPSDDTRKIMEMAIVRDNLYVLTQDPSGRLHVTSANGVTEPSGWRFDEVGANCGLLSPFGLTKSQADDSTASGGEEWFAWASLTGVRIFGGDQPWKISQEIQPDWDVINPAAYLTVWAMNDSVARTMYFGVPRGLNFSAPSMVYVLNYRELDTPNQIYTNAPFRTALSGKLVATDNTRKWTRWNLKFNGAALMLRATADLQPVFLAGNAITPGAFGSGNANVYTLNEFKLTDDDYGQIFSYYFTYAFVGRELEEALKLGAHRKIVAYLTAIMSGVGTVTFTLYPQSLNNPWPLKGIRTLVFDPTFDMEWGGGSCTGQRIFVKIASSPLTGFTDNNFVMSKLVLAMRPCSRLPVRGSAT